MGTEPILTSSADIKHRLLFIAGIQMQLQGTGKMYAILATKIHRFMRNFLNDHVQQINPVYNQVFWAVSGVARPVNVFRFSNPCPPDESE